MKLLVLYFLLLPLYTLPQSIIILVHGTWALHEQWYKQDGTFFETLQKHIDSNTKIVSFNWCGSNKHDKRKSAAQQLAGLIASYSNNTHIILVTHSHGGNVGILASQILAESNTNRYRIKYFYSLGTPVDSEDYLPDMNIIEHFYHFFSFEDLVQPVLGMFKRQYPQHERIANICVTINGTQPDHSGLHHPLIAKWIPHLNTMLSKKSNIFRRAGILHLFNDTLPEYEIDNERQDKIEQDLRLQTLILMSFRKRLQNKIRSIPSTSSGRTG